MVGILAFFGQSMYVGAGFAVLAWLSGSAVSAYFFSAGKSMLGALALCLFLSSSFVMVAPLLTSQLIGVEPEYTAIIRKSE